MASTPSLACRFCFTLFKTSTSFSLNVTFQMPQSVTVLQQGPPEGPITLASESSRWGKRCLVKMVGGLVQHLDKESGIKARQRAVSTQKAAISTINPIQTGSFGYLLLSSYVFSHNWSHVALSLRLCFGTHTEKLLN